MNVRRLFARTGRSRVASSVLAVALMGAGCAGSGGVEVVRSVTDGGAESEIADAPGATGAPLQNPMVEAAQAPEIEPSAVLAAADVFTSDITTDNAQQLIDAIAADGDERWAPWLIDLLRLDTSLATSNAASQVLGVMTGIPSESRIPDMIAYGGWSTTRAISGGDGYRDFKVALYSRIDPRFGPLLDSVDDQVELAGIQWGGVPVGGIPELNEPARVAATDATWMVDDEVVLGVVINGDAVAYPLRILARHELANDTVGGDAIAVVYCTLCRSAIVYDRQIDGQVVQFLTSGLLANSNKIMLDIETQTLWSHLRGIGIGGTNAGTELTVRPVNHARWSDWVTEHPDTEVLALPDPIFSDDPERPPIAYDYTPGEAYRSYYENPDVWFPVIDTPAVWPLKTEVLGIEAHGDSLAISIEDLNDNAEVLEVEVGGEIFVIEPTGVGARVLDRSGEQVITEQSFWFAWYANHPETRTLTGL